MTADSLSRLSFMDHACGLSKKLLPHIRLFRFSPMLSSRNFTVSYFIFRSIIQFRLIFVLCIKSESRLFFVGERAVVLAPFAEETIFATLYCLHFFAKDQMTVFMLVYFWALYCLTDLFVCSLPHITVLIAIAL